MKKILLLINIVFITLFYNNASAQGVIDSVIATQYIECPGEDGCLTVYTTGNDYTVVLQQANSLLQMQTVATSATFASSVEQFCGLSSGVYQVLLADVNYTPPYPTGFNFDPNTDPDIFDAVTAVLIEPLPLAVNLTAGNVSANGACDGWLNASVSGGTVPYTYLWDDNAVFPQTTQTATNLCGGTYCVTVTDTFGCLDTSCFSVIINQTYGCTDSTATNYDPLATVDDGSCTYQTKTYVPDDNFEQALINLGYDNVLDDSVLTANINTVTFLDVRNEGIADLTGIEGFISLDVLECNGNQLTSLDVSNNTALTVLNCGIFNGVSNQLTSLDVSNNTALTSLWCNNNQLTNLDVSNNTALFDLRCGNNQLTSLDISNNTAIWLLQCFNNQLTSLDVSNNTALISLSLYNNQLSSLDLSNGINTNFTYFDATNNPNLSCIDVDDPSWSTSNWTVANGNIDPQHYFSTNCSGGSTYGCTDPAACNYDPLATIDDGSCSYGSSSTSTQTINACDSYTAADGTVYTADTTGATATVLNAVGCDSVITYNIDISTGITNIPGGTAVSSCDSYTAPSGAVYTTSGAFLDTVIGVNGCPVVTTYNLTITTNPDVFVALNGICDSYTDENGTVYTANGLYTYVRANASNGCDETVNLTISGLLSSSTVSATYLGCSDYTYGDSTYTASATVLDTLVAANGCDSVVTVTIDINSATSANTENVTACDSYTAGDGTVYTTSQTFTDMGTNMYGCDSIVLVTLTINNSTSYSYTLVECDTFTWWANNQTYTASGTYVAYFQNAVGCDSVVTLNLTIDPSNAKTYVPDDNFEQELINLGIDTDSILNDSVFTCEISAVNGLYLSNMNISDLTGIEDFTTLNYLSCQNNQLTSLDVSNNLALTSLLCGGNQLTSLDVNNNTALISLSLYNNQLSSLDLSNNTALQVLNCQNNQLTTLDVRNGNNTNITNFYVHGGNFNLYCIDVDDPVYSAANWVYINSWTNFSNNCNTFTIFGCTDSTALNYDPSANTSDSSCIPFIYGCTDFLANNYDTYSNTDDGSCIYSNLSCFITADPSKLSETTIGTTTYDLQSNASLQNRIVVHDDGTISAGWTMSQQYNTTYSDRGTGYNFFDGTSWGAQPTTRLESSRGGWPSIIALGNGGECAITHNTDNSLINNTSRTTIGSGSWTENTVTPDYLIWNRSASGGIDGNTIHMIGVTASSNFGGTPFNGLDGALVYYRSQDGGINWDITDMQLPGMDTSMYNGMSGDVYAIAAQENTVVVAYFDDWGDSYIVKSTDNGNTWTKTTFLDFPVDKYAMDDGLDLDNNGIMDKVYSTDNYGALILDDNGDAHVFYGIMSYADDDLADASSSWFPTTNGIAYWNESYGADTTPSTVQDPSLWYSDMMNDHLIAHAPDLNGDGQVSGIDSVGGYSLYYASRASMPSAGIDSLGNLYLSYSGYTETVDNGTQVFRHIYVTKSEDGGDTWSCPVNVTPHPSWNGMQECVFGSMSPVVDDKIRILYQKDFEPGLAARGDQDMVDNNDIVYLEVSVSVFDTSIYGCTYPLATNYDPLATVDDGSCIYCNISNTFMYSAPSTSTSCDGFILSSASSSFPITNYNWVNSQGSFMGSNNFISNICNDAYILTLTDSAGCTFVDTLILGTIFGCTDSLATNYNPFASIDDGSCLYPTVYGCTDSLAYNYNPIANTDDGSCQYCDLYVNLYVSQNSTPTACDGFIVITSAPTSNSPVSYLWSTGSTQNNIVGLCSGTYMLNVTDAVGCTIDTTINIGNIAVYGCTDPTACNYDATATIDDSSCEYDVINTTVVNACDNFVWYDANGDTIFTPLNSALLSGGGPGNYGTDGIYIDTLEYTNVGGCDSIEILNLTLNSSVVSPSQPINILVCDSFVNPFDGQVITSSGYWVLSTGTTLGGCDSLFLHNITIETCGCTDPLATNYDPLATIDDGSCSYTSVCANSPITGLFISDIIDDQVLANFDNMNTYDATGAQICRVDQIRIKYREVGTSAWSQKNIASPTGYDPTTGVCNSTQKTDKPIRNLTPATEYEWEVKVWYCNGGNGGWAVGPNFTTAGECPNVGNLTAYGANPTKATFDWDDSNGSYEFARIKMRVDSISNPLASDWFLVGGSGVSYGTFTKNKNGLVAGETYRGQARTWCDPNGGAYNALSWTSLVTWTQPASVRVEGGASIANLDVYPNPSRDVFNISFTSESIQDLRVRILNVVGEVIALEELQQFIGEYTKQINLEDNAKGIYFLEIETNDGVINKKLILQ